jgi:hypothetical protein
VENLGFKNIPAAELRRYIEQREEKDYLVVDVRQPVLEARKVEFLLAHLCHGVLACQPDSYGFQKTVDKCPLKSY